MFIFIVINVFFINIVIDNVDEKGIDINKYDLDDELLDDFTDFQEELNKFDGNDLEDELDESDEAIATDVKNDHQDNLELPDLRPMTNPPNINHLSGSTEITTEIGLEDWRYWSRKNIFDPDDYLEDNELFNLQDKIIRCLHIIKDDPNLVHCNDVDAKEYEKAIAKMGFDKMWSECTLIAASCAEGCWEDIFVKADISDLIRKSQYCICAFKRKLDGFDDNEDYGNTGCRGFKRGVQN